MRYLLVVSLLALNSWSFVLAADGDLEPNIPLIKVAEPKECPKDAKLVKINAQILDALNSTDAIAREAAAKALMKLFEEQIRICKKPYVPKLNNELNSETAEIRAVAVKNVRDCISEVRQANPKRFEELYRQMAALDIKERDASKTQLVNKIEFVVLQKLINKHIEDLASFEPAIVAEAQRKLQELGEDAAGFLVDALDEERLPVKNGAADALKAMGAAAKDEVAGLAFMLDNDNKITSKLVGQILENLGPDAVEATDDLIEYLRNDDKSVRRMAVNILKKMGPAAKVGVPDLVELLDEDDKSISALAVEVLINLGSDAKDGVEALATLVDDVGADTNVAARSHAAKVLGAIGPDAKAALEILKKHLLDANPQVKTAVAAAIARIEGN
ncbi:MAG: HEAT repeat domain-containing protein [Planctomycetota bacterium]